MLGIVDDPYLAWCIDEAAAIAHNLLLKQTADDQELVLEGPGGRYDPRDMPPTEYQRVDARATQQYHIKPIPGVGTVINGSFPVKWRDTNP